MKVIELDEYEATNLLGCLLRLCDTEHHNGDWFGQVAAKCLNFLKEEGVIFIENNYGDRIPLEKYNKVWLAIINDEVSIEELIDQNLLGDNI